MRTASASASVLCLILFAGTQSLAQDSGSAAPAGVEELPAVDVVQDTPAKKAARAKKKAVAVSPLSSVSGGAGTAGSASTAGQSAPTAATFVAPITVPSAVTNVTDTDIEHEGTGSIQQTLQQRVPGIIISDAAGNALRAELSFRGFDASPVSGRAQGLAVYQNGVRINEAFGDVVNWDAIPSNAISSMSVVSNNPSFGLNALGGAVSILMKDGFSYQGGELDVMGGSFGRKQVGIQAGEQFGNAGVYVASEWFEDDGYRDFSASEVRRFYGDIGLKGTFAELHFSLTAADNHFGATAAAPVELLDRSWSNTFTSPQTTDLEVYMPTHLGIGEGDRHPDGRRRRLLPPLQEPRHRRQRDGGRGVRRRRPVIGGNPAEEFLCLEGDLTDPIDPQAVISSRSTTYPMTRICVGSIERLATTSESWGGGLEAQEKSRLLGFKNLFIAGMSYDHGTSNYKTSSELGEIQPKYVVEGSGVYYRRAAASLHRAISTPRTPIGALYFSNAIDFTDALTVTVGGRYNHATITLHGQYEQLPRPQRHQQVPALQPDGRRQLQADAGHVGLRRLLGIESRADAGRTRLRRAGLPVPHRELPDRRPAAEPGGRAHGRTRPARAGLGLRRSLHVVGGIVPHAVVRRHPSRHGRQPHLLRECR